MWSRDVNARTNLALHPARFPPRLMLVPSEKFAPHIVRGGYNTGAYYVNVSAFGEVRPKLLAFAAEKEWRFSHGLRDQGLMNDYFRMVCWCRTVVAEA